MLGEKTLGIKRSTTLHTASSDYSHIEDFNMRLRGFMTFFSTDRKETRQRESCDILAPCPGAAN